MVSSDIELELIIERLSDHFLISPNALHRGEDDWEGFTLRERAMLSALLSMKSGWKTTRKNIDKLAPELGRDAINTVLGGLRSKRVLFTRRINAGHGRFTWQWKVFMRPQPKGADVFAGHAIDGPPVHGETAGRTIDGSTVDGPPVDGSPINGEPDANRSTLALEGPPEEKYPPTPHAIEPSAVAPVELKTKTGEGNSNLEPRAPDLIAAAIDQAIRLRPTWTPERVADVVADALAAGRPEPLIVAGIVSLARGDHGPTRSPRRLLEAGPWWDMPIHVPAPAPDRSPRCQRHGSHPARTCPLCASEQREPQPLSRAEALAAIRATTSAPKPPSREARRHAAVAARG